MAPDSSEQFVLLNQLGEEFAARYRRGERPALQEYIDRHPELAEEIREFFPAMVEMEQVKEAREKVAEPPATGPLPALERLGDYRILREIGRGGMGVVYEAEQLSLGRHVALKVLPRAHLVDARTKQRFEREARSAARLHHTNIVPVFGVGEHDGLPYYAMQFIEGLGLDDVLAELKRLQGEANGSRSAPSPGGAVRVSERKIDGTSDRREAAAADVARSLLTGRFLTSEAGAGASSDPEPAELGATEVVSAASASASAGADGAAPAAVAGRLSDSFSLSSSSVVLPGTASGSRSRSGRKRATYAQSVARIGVQVADALQHAHAQGVLHRDIKPSNLLLDTAGVVWVTDFGLAKADDQQNLTHTGDVLGTLRYMAPEAFDGRTDARSDVYSLGLTLYEMLAMRPAFDEKERNRLIKQVTTGEPARLDRIKPELPRDLVTIVHKAIERDPAQRYPTAAELMADLQRFLDDEPIQACRQTHWERYRRWARRNPGIAVLGGVLTAVLVLATVASLFIAALMTDLARYATRLADEQRVARADAERAKEQEAGQRTRAEAAQKAAETSRSQAMDALKKAEESFAKARSAVNDYLTAVSDDPKLKAPGLSPLRARLLQSALGFYQQFLRERGSDATLRRELAAVYSKVGTIMRDLGQAEPAVQSFHESRRLYEELAAEFPDDPALHDGLARAAFWLSDPERAIVLWEKLVRPDDPRFLADLGYAYDQLSVKLLKTDKAKALEYRRKALVVRERLVQLRPDDPDARRGLAASLNNIAELLHDDRTSERLALYRRAVEQSEAAYRLRPGDAITQQFLAYQLQNLATDANRIGEVEEYLAALRRRLEIFDRRARDNPGVPGYDSGLVEGFFRYVSALRLAGRRDLAAQVADRARDRLGETTEETPKFFQSQDAFSLEVHTLALERAKASGGGGEGPDIEREAAAAVRSLRQHVLAGWCDPNWMRSDPRTKALAQRGDFQELLARMDELAAAEAATKKPGASPEEKLDTRRSILATLEALARPLPPTRSIRQRLAQARQDLAQSLLDADRVEEARATFDEALAERQALLAEFPTDEALRIDVIHSQIATGDVLAVAGRLVDAVAAWEGGLAALEAELGGDPNRIALRVALKEALAQVGGHYFRLGLWPEAHRCYRRAFELQAPYTFIHWLRYALVLAELGDLPGCQDLIRRALGERPAPNDVQDQIAYARLILLAPSDDPRWTKAVATMVANPGVLSYGWDVWIRAFASIRLGKDEEGIDRLNDLPVIQTFWSHWIGAPLTLAELRRGHPGAAREALRQADEGSDRALRDRLADPPFSLRHTNLEWAHFRVLRREAHRAITGGPLPESPVEHLFLGRTLLALGRTEPAEAELDAAIRLRPEDAEVWLARARIFAGLGRKDRAAADMIKAQELRGGDPRTWVEVGRQLADLGEPTQADAAFARASELGGGELDRFLEAGWWVAGPYPGPFERACPPEVDPDPSRAVAGVGQDQSLRWQTVALQTNTYPARIGMIDLGMVTARRKDVAYYLLSCVHAARDRTATLYLAVTGNARVWVNGRLVFAGTAPWKYAARSEVPIPVGLTRGRNTILLKIGQAAEPLQCACSFHDRPELRATDLLQLGLWSEAADAFAEADRRSRLAPVRLWNWGACLLAAGREDESRRVFGELVRRHDRTSGEDVARELALVCLLPADIHPDRDRWLIPMRRHGEVNAKVPPVQHNLAYACFVAGRYAEAEQHLRRAIALRDDLQFRPLLAAVLHRLGRTEEARQTLQEAERRHAVLVERALTDKNHPLTLSPKQSMISLSVWVHPELWYQITLREARRAILGEDPGPTAGEATLIEKLRQRQAEVARAEDAFAALVIQYPDQPRLWIDRGRRLGELGRWDEAARAFASAIALEPGNPQVWKECGRAHAELGRWDEAVAELGKALELTPEPKRDFPGYPWRVGRGDVDELIAGSDELYARLARLRPDDRTLSARRAEALAEAGRWADADAALRNHLERFPDDWWAAMLLAKRLIAEGKLEEYQRVCRQALDRCQGKFEYRAALNTGCTALLAPRGLEDHPLLSKIVTDAGAQKVPEFWMQCTAALAELRRGDAAAALRRLDARVFADPGFLNTQAMADAIRALASQKGGLGEQAQAALGRVRAALEVHRRRPYLEGKAYDWHNWTQVEILAREAEGLIPSVPAAPASLAREQAERRERKARADRASARAALVLIHLDLGQPGEALSELQGVLAERARIAAEEPTDADYLADLAATYTLLAQAFMTPRVTEVLPTAERQGQVWRYTTQKPPDDWTRPGFDDRDWKQGPGGFGTAGTAGLKVGTTWNTSDIWIRRAVDLPASIDPHRLRFRVFHDEDFELAVNGILAVRRSGYITTYEAIEIPPDPLKSLKPGARIIVAAHCHQTIGGQGVDVGLSLVNFDPGTLGDTAQALRSAATVWARITPTDPRRNRIRQDLNALYLQIGEVLRKHKLGDAAARALREAGDILTRDAAEQAERRVREREARADLKDEQAHPTRIVAKEPASADDLADLAATCTQHVQLLMSPRVVEVLPTAEGQPAAWRYTTQKPPDNWTRPDFDDSAWKQGPGGFGTAGNPSLRAGTTWNTSDIWIRRAVDLPPALDPDGLRFRVYHDEDFELAVNGIPAASRSGYTTTYEAIEIKPDALELLEPGSRIVLAAHCRNTVGGRGGVDVGLSLGVFDPGTVGDAAQDLRSAAAVWARITHADPRRDRIRRDLNALYLKIVSLLEKHPLTDGAAEALWTAGDILTRDIATDAEASAAAWLTRCISQQSRGEQDDARAACLKAARLLKPPGADRALSRLVSMAVQAVGPESREATELLAAAGEPPTALTDAIRNEPKQAAAYLARAHWYGQHCAYAKAAADLAEADRLQPASLTSLLLGVALVHLGELDRYRELCRTMLDRWAGSTDSDDVERTVKACLLRPDSGVDLDRLARLVEVLTSREAKGETPEWYPLAGGLHAYRTGRLAESLVAYRESRQRNEKLAGGPYIPLTATTDALEAMVLFRQGDADAARRMLEDARSLIGAGLPSNERGTWWDWLAADLLAREARALIENPGAAARRAGR
jgi:serine/threonine protein kinase/tetratricopeptide (TPR) repeat protein